MSLDLMIKKAALYLAAGFVGVMTLLEMQRDRERSALLRVLELRQRQLLLNKAVTWADGLSPKWSALKELVCVAVEAECDRRGW